MQRAVLAALALAHGHTLTIDELVDSLWHHPPQRSLNAIQQHISALRATLGRTDLVTVPAGYRLDLEQEAVDVARFRRTVQHGEQARRAGNLRGAARTLQDALDLWQGPPAADLADCPLREQVAAALGQEHLAARLSWLAVNNDLGAGPSVLAEAEQLAAEQPLDEQVAAELMRALAEA